jgi:glycosyltransferase involved in cell wall biosynthesis
MAASLRVCIDARLGADGHSGGAQQVVLGLAEALADLDGGDEEYLFLVDWQSRDWLEPRLRGPCRVLPHAGSRGPATSGWKAVVKSVVPRPILELPLRAAVAAARVGAPVVPHSDGTVEGSGAQVFHQAVQYSFLSSVPSIYMPHDLQHVHLPGLFSEEALRVRRAVYPALARAAAAVVAFTKWGKEDVVRALDLPAGKVHVIPHGPGGADVPEPSPAELAAVRARIGLDGPFALYPAQTWPHKNHLRLLQALAWLRDRDGLGVPIVLSGHQSDHFPALADRVRALGLREQVRFVGFVSPLELKALYRLARLLVFPSLFEGFGMPVLEAFRLGLPVACSRATCLPEVAGDAAVLFDPESPESIATAIRELWSSEARRLEAARKGSARAEAFTWRRAALRYRALYRKTGGRPLAEADRELLAGTV